MFYLHVCVLSYMIFLVCDPFSTYMLRVNAHPDHGITLDATAGDGDRDYLRFY